MALLCVLVFALCAGSSLGSSYNIPAPVIEAFSPKGLRLSIPDSEGVTSVQFFLSFNQALPDKEPGNIAKHVDDKKGTQWIYYNPSIALKPGQLVNYQITVYKDGQSSSKQGTYIVDKVITSSDSHIVADCEDEGQQVASFPNIAQFSQSGKKSETKSFFKSFDSKPVTRSSTTTTSGSFYVKPSGVVEASGYKASSNYDSTRREGEQWQHSKSELTAAEIEELKRLHGQEFFTLPQYAHLRGASGGSSSSFFESSGYSSASQTRPVYQSSLNSASQQGSSYHGVVGTPPPPLLRPSGGYSSYSAYERHESSALPSSSYPASLHAVPLGHEADLGQMAHSVSSDIHESEVGQIQSKPSSSYSNLQTNYRKETVQSLPAASYPYSKSQVQETREFISPPRTVVSVPFRVPSPLAVTYNGDIFRSTVRPSSPQSCTAADYGRRADLVSLEKSVKEMECLAVLAEATMKAEVYALKEANTELKEKFSRLEEQFRRFQNECKCY